MDTWYNRFNQEDRDQVMRMRSQSRSNSHDQRERELGALQHRSPRGSPRDNTGNETGGTVGAQQEQDFNMTRGGGDRQ